MASATASNAEGDGEEDGELLPVLGSHLLCGLRFPGPWLLMDQACYPVLTPLRYLLAHLQC